MSPRIHVRRQGHSEDRVGSGPTGWMIPCPYPSAMEKLPIEIDDHDVPLGSQAKARLSRCTFPPKMRG